MTSFLSKLSPRPNQWIEIGRILRPHGLRGGIKIQSFSAPAQKFFNYPLHWTSHLSPQELYFKVHVPMTLADLKKNASDAKELEPLFIASHFPLKAPFFVIFLPPSNALQAQELSSPSDESFFQRGIYLPRSAIEHTFCQADWLYRWVYNEKQDQWGIVADVHDFGAGEVLEIFWQATAPSCWSNESAQKALQQKMGKSFINLSMIDDIQDGVLKVRLGE